MARGSARTTMGLEISGWIPESLSWPTAYCHPGLLILSKHDLSFHTIETFGFHSWHSGQPSLYIFFLWKFHSIIKAMHVTCKKELPQWLSGKQSACNAGDSGDAGSIPGLGRSSGGGHSNQLQYSCQENTMDRGAWWATVHGVAKNEMLPKHARTQLVKYT